jgi:hypothetical protein
MRLDSTRLDSTRLDSTRLDSTRLDSKLKRKRHCFHQITITSKYLKRAYVLRARQGQQNWCQTSKQPNRYLTNMILAANSASLNFFLLAYTSKLTLVKSKMASNSLRLQIKFSQVMIPYKISNNK